MREALGSIPSSPHLLFTINVVFPMHFWEDFQAAARFKALACADGYKDRIQEIHRRGEEFLV